MFNKSVLATVLAIVAIGCNDWDGAPYSKQIDVTIADVEEVLSLYELDAIEDIECDNLCDYLVEEESHSFLVECNHNFDEFELDDTGLTDEEIVGDVECQYQHVRM